MKAVSATTRKCNLNCSLCQVAYAPLAKPSAASAPPGAKDPEEKVAVVEDKFVMTEELYERLSADQEKYRAELTALVERTYQPTIVKNLIILQSNSSPPTTEAVPPRAAQKGAKKATVAPSWFSRRVGELLSGRLVASQNGVAHVIRGVLDMGGDSGDAGAAAAMDWTKIELIANVLASPPQGNYASVEKYYSLVCPQVLRLVEDGEDKIFQMIACAAVKTMTERSLILSRRYILDRLLAPILLLAEGAEKEAKDTQAEFALPTEAELDSCLKTLYKVFVIGNDPSMMFVAHLEPIVLILLELHAAIVFRGTSHLIGPVKQLVQRYLKLSDRSTTVATLRAFAFAHIPPELEKSRLKTMNPVSKGYPIFFRPLFKKSIVV